MGDPRNPTVERLERRQLFSIPGVHVHWELPAKLTVTQEFFGTLATLKHPARVVINPSTVVDWGDGTVERVDAGAIDSQNAYLRGDHTYAQPGHYVLRTTFFSGAKIAGRFSRQVIVTGNSSGGMELFAQTGQPFTGTIGTFTADHAITTSVVQWGDGTQGIGVVTSVGDGKYMVTSSHTYLDPGTYHVRVEPNATLSTPGVPLPLIPVQIETTPPIVSTMHVGGSATTGIKPAVTLLPDAAAVYKDSFDTPLASASGLAASPYVAGPYATISWDGQPAYAGDTDVVFDNGTYEVRLVTPSVFNSTQPPAAPVSHQAVITLLLNDHVDSNQNTVLATTRETVTFEPTSRGGLVLHLSAGQAFNGPIGVFYGTPGLAPPVFTINWNDGSPGTPATLTALGNDAYSVSGSHAFANPGSYEIIAYPSQGGDFGTSLFSVVTVV